jgi:hypothetical protein
MRLIFDNNESAAPLAPLLLATEEDTEAFFNAMEETIRAAEEGAKQSNEPFIEAQQSSDPDNTWLIVGR